MKAPDFEYFAPESLSDALGYLHDDGPEAQVLAGGQSLMPLLNTRRIRPKVLVDLGRVEGLRTIEVRGDSLSIGAMVSQAVAMEDSKVTSRAPLLAIAISHVASGAIRNRGTIAGSVASAYPASEVSAALLALEATIVAQSAMRPVRQIPIDEFFTAAFSTVLEQGEIITSIEIPAPDPEMAHHWGFNEVSRLHNGPALAGAAVQIGLRDDAIASLRLAVIGVGPTPMRLHDVEQAGHGERPSKSLIEDLASAARDAVAPTGRDRSATYEGHLLRAVVERALSSALDGISA